MKYNVTNYLAFRAENEILNYFEGDKIKVLCVPQPMNFSTSSIPTEQKFLEIMERSKKAYKEGKEDFWIAAIGYMDNLFKEDKSSIIVT